MPLPSLETAVRAANRVRAVALRARGTLIVSPEGTRHPLDLLLSRSGALRLELGGEEPSSLAGDGVTLHVRDADGTQRRRSAWQPAVADAPRLLDRIAVADLLDALLPRPLPGDGSVAIDRVAGAQEPLVRLTWRLAGGEGDGRRSVYLGADLAPVRLLRVDGEGRVEARIEYLAWNGPAAGPPSHVRICPGGGFRCLAMELDELQLDPATAFGDWVLPPRQGVGAELTKTPWGTRLTAPRWRCRRYGCEERA